MQCKEGRAKAFCNEAGDPFRETIRGDNAMRKLDGWLFVSIAFLNGISLASAQPNQYCQSFFDQMAPDTLYVANCTAQANCLKKVVDYGGNAVLQAADGSTDQLKKAEPYNFIYKTTSEGLPNSLVIVQIKQLDAARTNPTPSPVRLRRYAFNFACYQGSRNAPAPQWPSADVRGRDLTAIPYSNYDEFHRTGATNAEQDAILRTRLGFHVRYNNGVSRTCVSTLDPERRAQFLMEDWRNYAGHVGGFFISLGAYSTTASAQSLDDVRKYERLKVLLSNYSRGGKTEGCVGFSTKAGGPQSTHLDIVLRDIERQVQASGDTSRTWSFALQ
jgi:hypothetical protein